MPSDYYLIVALLSNMHSKLTAIIVLSVLAFGLFSPLALDGEDGLDRGDFYISISDNDGQRVDVTIGNGQTATWNLYVVNVSEKYLEISYETEVSDEEVSVIDIPGPMMLGPTGGDILSSTTGIVTIQVDRYAKDTSEFTATVTVRVANVADNTDFVDTDITFYVTVDSTFDTSGMFNKFMGCFDNPLPSPFNNPIITMVISIILWMLIIGLILRLLIPVLARILDKTTPDIDDREHFERALFYLSIPLVFLLSFNQGLYIVGASNEIIAGFGSLSNILYVIIISLFAWRIYVYIVASILNRFEKDEKNNSTIDMSLLPLFKMIGRIIIAVCAVSAILGSFGVDLQGILVSAGIISLGITMGAQNVLSQFFSGLVILSTRPFKAGDFLKINDNVYIVKKVKIMYTVFTSWENDRLITMPNNAVTSATIQNMTENGLPVKNYIYFTVAYGSDLEKAKEIMIDAAMKNPLVVTDGSCELPGYRMTNTLNSGIELRLSYFARSFDDTGGSAAQIRQAVYKEFRENDIEIPYDRLQIDILSDVTGKRPDDLTQD